MVIRHFVRHNPRLHFKNSHLEVEAFMRKRATKFGVNIEFCADFPIPDSSTNGIWVFSEIINPFSDYDELESVLKAYANVDWKELNISGLVPGTEFSRVLNTTAADSAGIKSYISSVQERHNLQINVFKFKRLKVFLSLLKFVPDMHKLSIEQFAGMLEKPEVFEHVLSYGEKLNLEHRDSCPICKSSNLEKLYPKDSQAFLGFMTRRSSFYTRCLACEIIFLNPCPISNDLHKVYDEFDKQDFAASINFPYDDQSQRGKFILDLGMNEKTRSLDLGGGIGKFSQFLKRKNPTWEVTHSDFGIKQYPELEVKGIKTRALDFTNSPIGDREYDLITMWEVIEHIHPEKLKFVFDNILKALSPGGVYVFSTPNFDSPLCQAFDFYSACPPFHTFVFSEAWLKAYFIKYPGFELVKIGYCSDFLDDLSGWMDYASMTAPTFTQRGVAKFVSALSRSSQIEKEKLTASMQGSEVIFCLRRKQ